jgi:ribosomal protein L7Ae-like RNA K-turn-binding protein
MIKSIFFNNGLDYEDNHVEGVLLVEDIFIPLIKDIKTCCEKDPVKVFSKRFLIKFLDSKGIEYKYYDNTTELGYD